MLNDNRLFHLGTILIFSGFVGLVAAVLFWSTGTADTRLSLGLQTLQERGYIKCGVASNRPGLSVVNRDSQITVKTDLQIRDNELTLFAESQGLEADMCRAVAIALFGETENHLLFHIADGGWNHRMEQIVNGTIDVLFRQVELQTELGTTHAVDHSPVVFFDRIALLTSLDNHSADASLLKKQAVCSLSNSMSEKSALQFSLQNGMQWQLSQESSIRNYADAYEVFSSGSCSAMVGRFSALHTLMVNKKLQERFHLILLSDVQTVPTVGVVKNNAQELKELVTQSIWTILRAAATNQTADTAEADFNSDYWQRVNLNTDYPRRIIQQLGNYDTIYQRHFAAVLPDPGPNTHIALSAEGKLVAPE